MSARERILARINNGTRNARKDAQPGNQANAITSHLARHPRGPQPPQPDDLLACFSERARRLSSDLLETGDTTEIPALLARYLSERKLPMQGVCWTSLAGLPWNESGLEITPRPAGKDDLLGVTGAYCAIAETGTLMMLSGAETPATTSLLPETHVAVVNPQRIVATMEDAWDLLRREFRQPPRAVNFISGPSRTADIEQTVTLGAHGPYRVLLILAPLEPPSP